MKYFPVDASQTLLETACAGAEDDDCEALGLKADISSPVHLLLAADVSEAPRLFLMVGNTLGGFDPLDQMKHVAGCLHKGDILIVDARIDAEDDAGEPNRSSEALRSRTHWPAPESGRRMASSSLWRTATTATQVSI